MLTGTDYDAIARQVARDAGLPGDRYDLRRLTGGVANHVYCLDGRWTIRLGTRQDGKCFPKSAALLRAVEGRMLAPRVLYTDFGQTRYPWNVMVCSYLPGAPLRESWTELAETDRLGVLAAIPAQLRVLHALPRECLAGVQDLSPPSVSIERHFTRFLAGAEGKIDPGILAVVRRYVEGHWSAVADEPPAVIIHNDVHWNNTLVADGRFAGLVDFDDAEVGWAEMDAWAMVHMLAETEAPEALTLLSRPDSMRRACQAVRRLWPGALDAPGCLERYVICQIVFEIVGNLAEPPFYLSVEECRELVRQIWQALFDGPGARAWFLP